MDEVSKFLELFSVKEQSKTIQKLSRKFLGDQMWIADGMYLSVNRKDDLQYFILDEKKCKEYEKQFLIFAKATHSGSSYAFYKIPGSVNCDEWPIIVLGDEGGVVVLAKNIFDLMRFWTLNSVAPYVNTSDYKSFDLSYDLDLNENNDEYRLWINTEFGIQALNNIEEAKTEIIQPAIEIFQKEIDQIFSPSAKESTSF